MGQKMINFLIYFVVLLSIGTITASPTTRRNSTICVLKGTSIDNLEQVKSSCKEIIVGQLNVPAGKTLDFSGISDLKIIFRGNVSFGYAEWRGPLVLISGTNITVLGEEGHVFDGNGQRWWDSWGGNGGKLKPTFFKASYIRNGSFKNLKFLNSPRHCFVIHNCTNVNVTNIHMDFKDGDKYGGHNTGGFNVKVSENIYIRNVFVYNQGDCFAVRSGNNIHFKGGYCSGSHGLSVGSTENWTNNNVVKNVFITNCTLVNTENGIGINTVAAVNTTGLVSGITFSDIHLINATKYGIAFREDYRTNSSVPTGGIPIYNVTVTNVRGTVRSNATNILILLSEGVAKDWYWHNVNITGGLTFKNCTGIPQGSGAFC